MVARETPQVTLPDSGFEWRGPESLNPKSFQEAGLSDIMRAETGGQL